MLSKFSKEHGSVSIIAAIAMTVLIAFSAIAVDVGRIALEKQALQNALDAAALAGAQELPDSISNAQLIATTYFEQNGFSDEAIRQIEFLNDNREIRMTASQPVEYTFAKIFDQGDGATVTVHAAAQISSVFEPFHYTLFSGSDMDLLQFKGSNVITGNVHSNNSVKNAAEVIGVVTAVNTIDPRVNATGGTFEGYAYVSMPDLSDVVHVSAVMDQNTLINVFGAIYSESKNEYSLSDDQLNWLLSVYPTLMIDGGLVINGSGIDSIGTIITSGDIVFNGSDVSMNASDSVCLYSIGGSITFNGGNGSVNGILYAPVGTIRLNGSGGVFYGSIVGNVVTCDGGIHLVYDSQAAGSVPRTITRLVE